MKYLAVLLLSFSLVACVDEDAKKVSYDDSAKHLVFSSLDRDDLTLKLQHLAGDKPVVMNVWATWCPPCIKELPSLQKLADKKIFSVITVSIDRDRAKVKAFLHRNGFTRLPVVWDQNGKALKEAFGLNGVPTTYILDRSKKVVAVEKGERDWAHPAMVAKIKEYLK